jgi:hypothetical protein
MVASALMRSLSMPAMSAGTARRLSTHARVRRRGRRRRVRRRGVLAHGRTPSSKNGLVILWRRCGRCGKCTRQLAKAFGDHISKPTFGNRPPSIRKRHCDRGPWYNTLCRCSSATCTAFEQCTVYSPKCGDRLRQFLRASTVRSQLNASSTSSVVK